MIVAHTGGNSKEFGGPIYLGQFVYKTCTKPLASAKAPPISTTSPTSRATRRATATPTTPSTIRCGPCSCRTTTRSPDLTINLGLRYEQQTFTDSRLRIRAARGLRLQLARRWQDRRPRRLRHLLFADRRQLRSQLRAHRTNRRFQLHRRARPDRIPHQRRGRSTACISRPAPTAAAQSLHPARRQRVSQSVLSHIHADRVSEATAESILEAMDLRHRAPLAAWLGAERRLRRLAHHAHQSPAGCRSARAVHPHRARPGSHRAGRELHASLLDLVVRAERA